MKNIFYVLVMLFPAIWLWGNVPENASVQDGVNVPESINAPDAVNVPESISKQDGAGKAALNKCSDEVFLRRTYLVLTGRLPKAEKAEQFLTATQPDKRALLIDSLLDSEEHVRYMVMRWGDILRIKSEFPSNLWPNGVQAYNRWVYEQINTNVPYNEFVRRLLLSSGSNFRSPAVNFYRAFLKKTPDNIYQNINVVFLGKRNCKDEGAACFEQLKYKSTKEWKEEIIYIDTEYKARKRAVKLADNTQLPLKEGEDWRKAYVDWLTHPSNQQFAAVMTNRLWYWVFGKGIVNEPDDWGAHNPPSDKALLDKLTRQFIASGYDTKALLKLILNSEQYQYGGKLTDQEVAAGESMNAQQVTNVHSATQKLQREGVNSTQQLPAKATFTAQRLPAEVLVDALADVTGISDEYRSRVPEPFTYYPAGTRSVDLGDATVSSSALELFGRVSRDVSLESQRNSTLTARQLLYLMNARELEERIRKSPVLNELSKQHQNIPALCRAITLMTLSRFPTKQEIDIYREYAKTNKLSLRNLATDILWTQINSIEFLYNH